MSQKIDSITACNKHEILLVPFKYGGTDSLPTGNIMSRKTSSVRDPFGLGRWSWQKFRGQGNVSQIIPTFYMSVYPAQG